VNGTRSRLDLSRLPVATILLLGGGVLYFLDLFLSWRRQCFDFGALGVHCGTQNGVAQGVGVINLLLALGIIVTEILVVTSRNAAAVTGPGRQREAAMAVALLVFTVIMVLVGLSHIYVWSFVGLLLAIAIAYGGWLRWREAQASSGPPPRPTGGLPG
jgi:hypothetical protein